MKYIQRRLNRIYGLLIILSFIFLGAVFLLPLENYFIAQAKANLAPQARLAAQTLKPFIINKQLQDLRVLVNELGKENSIRLTIIAPNGYVIADSKHDYKSMDWHYSRPEVKKALNEGIGFSTRMSDTLKEKMLYCAYKEHTTGYIVRVAVSLWRIDEIFNHIRNSLFALLCFTAIITLYAGSKTARTITDPIEHLKSVAQEISEGNFASQANVTTEDELADLARALNLMAQKLKLYVQSINAEKEQLNTIFEHLSEGVVVLNESGEILMMNSTTEKLFNYTRQQLLGQMLHRILRDSGFEESLKIALKKNLATEYEFRYREHFLHLNFVPLSTIWDKKILVLIYDTTTFKQWQQMRSDFVANASHELRTPLTSIKGYTETLLDGALEEKNIARNFLEIIDRESERLTRIVEDLLDLSRLERKTTLHKVSFELEELISQVINNFQTSIRAKGLKYETLLPPHLLVFADRDWLEQVIVNLIDNAVKYSKIGGSVKLQATEQEDFVEIKVSDTGIGIPYEDLPRIFERFYRVDKSRSRSLGGTGLGLAIVKHIIESHGGTVDITSILGEGTTLTMRLPKEA